MRILLIEDDANMAGSVCEGLREDNHVLSVARDGHAGLFQAVGADWDLLIVDRMLPGLDGLSLVRALCAGRGR